MLKCTAAWVSVENHVDRGNAGQWKARESDETASLPFPPPLEIAAAISHIPTASTTTGYIFCKSRRLRDTRAESTVKTPSWTVLEREGDYALIECPLTLHGQLEPACGAPNAKTGWVVLACCDSAFPGLKARSGPCSIAD